LRPPQALICQPDISGTALWAETVQNNAMAQSIIGRRVAERSANASAKNAIAGLTVHGLLTAARASLNLLAATAASVVRAGACCSIISTLPGGLLIRGLVATFLIARFFLI
jgi:hypothetical protein